MGVSDNMERQRGFEPVSNKHLKSYDKQENVILPFCKTRGSAGYDFVAPYSFMLGRGETKIVWSDVKAYMNINEELLIFIRSSVGIKMRVNLLNNVGVIDSDYYNNHKNNGNIGISLVNNSDRLVIFNKGDGIAQGTFYNFLKADNCNGDENRNGGLGSTNL